jgi:hypothetical protein
MREWIREPELPKNAIKRKVDLHISWFFLHLLFCSKIKHCILFPSSQRSLF